MISIFTLIYTNDYRIYLDIFLNIASDVSIFSNFVIADFGPETNYATGTSTFDVKEEIISVRNFWYFFSFKKEFEIKAPARILWTFQLKKVRKMLSLKECNQVTQ